MLGPRLAPWLPPSQKARKNAEVRVVRSLQAFLPTTRCCFHPRIWERSSCASSCIGREHVLRFGLAASPSVPGSRGWRQHPGVVLGRSPPASGHLPASPHAGPSWDWYPFRSARVTPVYRTCTSQAANRPAFRKADAFAPWPGRAGPRFQGILSGPRRFRHTPLGSPRQIGHNGMASPRHRVTFVLFAPRGPCFVPRSAEHATKRKTERESSLRARLGEPAGRRSR